MFPLDSPGAENEPLRWKWKRGDLYAYNVHGTLIRKAEDGAKTFAENVSVVYIRPVGPDRAYFTQIFSSVTGRDEGGIPYSVPKEELQKKTVVFMMTPESQVAGKAGAANSDYLRGIFPLPEKTLAPGEYEEMGFSQGSGLSGRMTMGNETVTDAGREAVLTFEYSGENGSKTVEGFAVFLAEKGYFKQSGRKITSRTGAVEEVRGLEVKIESSPDSESPYLKNARRLEELKSKAKKGEISDSERLEMGKIALKVHEYDYATDVLEKLVGEKPEDYEAKTIYAGLLLLIGDMKAAEKRFEEVLALKGDYRPALLGLGDLMLRTKRYRRAEELARSVLAADVTNYRGYYLLGLALARRGEKAEAVKAIEKYLRYNPEIEKGLERKISFTPEGELRIHVKRDPGTYGAEGRLSEKELEQATRLLETVISEEGSKLDLEEDEVKALLAFMAELTDTTAHEMVSEFVKDSESVFRKLKDALEAHFEVDREEVREILKNASSEDEFFGASSFAPHSEAIELYRKRVKEAEPSSLLYLGLAEHLVSGVGKAVDYSELRRNLAIASAMDDENGLYDFVIAYCYLFEGQYSRVIEHLEKGLGKKKLTSYRSKLARARLNVLEKTGYREEIRKSTAYSGTPLTFFPALKYLGETIEKTAETVAGGGNIEKALYTVELLHSLGEFLEKKASRPPYYALGLDLQRSALEMKASLVEKQGGADTDRLKDVLLREKEIAERLIVAGKTLKNMEWIKEKAFRVLVITKPEEAEKFADNLIEDEMKLFRKYEAMNAEKAKKAEEKENE